MLVCRKNCEILWERVPYLSALEVWSRQGTIQIHVYLYYFVSWQHCWCSSTQHLVGPNDQHPAAAAATAAAATAAGGRCMRGWEQCSCWWQHCVYCSLKERQQTAGDYDSFVKCFCSCLSHEQLTWAQIHRYFLQRFILRCVIRSS